MEFTYDYVIVGGGLAGACAVEGIRLHDRKGSIALCCKEDRAPYHRPPLSKDLWSGKKRFDQINAQAPGFYFDQKADLRLGCEITSLDPGRRQVRDGQGNTYHYGRLLLATGGEPRRLPNDQGLVHYYRTAQDYLDLRQASERHQDFLVIGGNFMGAELAASLRLAGKRVTLIFPESTLFQRLFPADLATFVTQYYRRKGVEVLSEDFTVSYEDRSGKVSVATHGHQSMDFDWVVAGVGIDLNLKLASQARLRMDRGVVVNDLLQTSDPAIFCAGDLARFPAQALDETLRVEHWDNARSQGKLAGENMAGAGKRHTVLPFFFSDLFELGFEAVGELDSRLQTFSDWQEPFKKGVVYYLDQGKVRGVLLWNVWKKVDAARHLIGLKRAYQRPQELKGSLELVGAGK
jgi:NADPH-dependent 2,4-dienoyl-CoA reductase/sulfur reductase-like enzyme